MKTFVIVEVIQEHLKKKNKVTGKYVFNLAQVITGCKTVSELTLEEKYRYLTKQYCLKNQNLLFKKHCINEGENKNLTYHFSWIQNKP